MKELVFAVTVLYELLLLALFVLTLVIPGSRSWPPLGWDFSRWYRYDLPLTAASFAGIVALGLSIGAGILS